jgi:hypothetical protein
VGAKRNAVATSDNAHIETVAARVRPSDIDVEKFIEASSTADADESFEGSRIDDMIRRLALRWVT